MWTPLFISISLTLSVCLPHSLSLPLSFSLSHPLYLSTLLIFLTLILLEGVADRDMFIYENYDIMYVIIYVGQIVKSLMSSYVN